MDKVMLAKLKTDEKARTKLIADLKNLLSNQGIDLQNPKIKKLLDLDVKDGKKFVDGINASTVVVTLVM